LALVPNKALGEGLALVGVNPQPTLCITIGAALEVLCMASSKVHGSITCVYCGKAFRSAIGLARHLDTRHQGWVEAILANIGVPIPGVYPVPEYRTAIAEAFATDRDRAARMN
jgi:hypothetical protein